MPSRTLQNAALSILIAAIVLVVISLRGNSLTARLLTAPELQDEARIQLPLFQNQIRTLQAQYPIATSDQIIGEFLRLHTNTAQSVQTPKTNQEKIA